MDFGAQGSNIQRIQAWPNNIDSTGAARAATYDEKE
jgi:hypothetical protein